MPPPTWPDYVFSFLPSVNLVLLALLILAALYVSGTLMSFRRCETQGISGSCVIVNSAGPHAASDTVTLTWTSASLIASALMLALRAPWASGRAVQVLVAAVVLALAVILLVSGGLQLRRTPTDPLPPDHDALDQTQRALERGAVPLVGGVVLVLLFLVCLARAGGGGAASLDCFHAHTPG